MSERFAALYQDETLGIDKEGSDLVSARHWLNITGNDTELVEVEVRIVQSHGKPAVQTEFCL